jgi:hypothetical protein
MQLPGIGLAAVGWSIYDFSHDWNDADAVTTVPVRVSGCCIQVFWNGKWDPISACIERLNLPNKKPFDSHLALVQQQNFWATNGK